MELSLTLPLAGTVHQSTVGRATTTPKFVRFVGFIRLVYRWKVDSHSGGQGRAGGGDARASDGPRHGRPPGAPEQTQNLLSDPLRSVPS